MSDDTYTCGRCRQSLPADMFAPSARRNGCYCRNCNREYFAARSRREAAERLVLTGQRTCANPECGKDISHRRIDALVCSPRCGETVRRRNQGITAREPRFPELADADWLAQAYGSGLTQRQIAKKLGCTKSTVASALKGAGIEPRSAILCICEMCHKHFHSKGAKTARFCGTRCEVRFRGLSRYGITRDEYLALIERQGECCGVCGTNACVSGKSFAVDHDHETGAIRGLLCTNCNTGLGQFKDDPDVLRRAVDYLEKARAIE